MIDETSIMIMTPEGLFERDLLFELMENEPEERARLTALFLLRAKELGVEKNFTAVLKAYTEADKKLAAEYNRKWRQQNCSIDLDFDGTGKALSNIENYIKVLENDPYFKGLKFNLLTIAPEQERNGEIFQWTDADDAQVRRYIETKYKFHNAQKCSDAMRIVFKNNEYHPIRDLIDSIEWDGESRIYNFLSKWTKCDDTPYTREVSRLIFAGGIHRLYNPGCKFDDMPVLIGTKQGEGKSTLVRWLAMEDRFFNEVNEFDSQRGVEALEGAWICEVSELLAMTKTKDVEAVKSFLTRQNDRRRAPYDKRTTDHPRQCIFIGTTNKEQFLTDKTGNRRFYPVTVRQNGYELFDSEKEIKEYIRQCWAEAKHLFDKGELKPYADRELKKEITAMQMTAVQDDYRVGMIEAFLEDKDEVCALELWQEGLQNSMYSKPDRKDSNELVLIMQNFHDWERQPKAKRFGSYGLQRYWKRVCFDSGPFDEDAI